MALDGPERRLHPCQGSHQPPLFRAGKGERLATRVLTAISPQWTAARL